MKKAKQILKRLWEDESGQGTTEYILMLVVVVGIVIALKGKITEAIGDKVEGLKSALGDVTHTP